MLKWLCEAGLGVSRKKYGVYLFSWCNLGKVSERYPALAEHEIELGDCLTGLLVQITRGEEVTVLVFTPFTPEQLRVWMRRSGKEHEGGCDVGVGFQNEVGVGVVLAGQSGEVSTDVDGRSDTVNGVSARENTDGDNLMPVEWREPAVPAAKDGGSNLGVLKDEANAGRTPPIGGRNEP